MQNTCMYRIIIILSIHQNLYLIEINKGRHLDGINAAISGIKYIINGLVFTELYNMYFSVESP